MSLAFLALLLVLFIFGRAPASSPQVSPDPCSTSQDEEIAQAASSAEQEILSRLQEKEELSLQDVEGVTEIMQEAFKDGKIHCETRTWDQELPDATKHFLNEEQAGGKALLLHASYLGFKGDSWGCLLGEEGKVSIHVFCAAKDSTTETIYTLLVKDWQ